MSKLISRDQKEMLIDVMHMHLPKEDPSSLRTESRMGSVGSLSYEKVRRWKLPIRFV